MTTNQIVVAYDFTHSGRSALLRAIATASHGGCVLHFICVIEPHGSLPTVPRTGPVDYRYAERVQQKLTEEVSTELRAASVPATIEFFVHARIGKPVDEILELAREVGADSIIIGTKGLTGVERLLLGSIAERVAREARCPVEIARPKQYEDVALMEIVEVEPEHHHAPPYHYSYERHQILARSNDWPLY